jgi:VWFA-related protein
MRALRIAFALSIAAAGLRLAAAQTQTFQENVQVDLVRVDLFVTDAAGRPIRDLSPSEVHLEIDGRKQPIVGLEPVSGEPAAAQPASFSAPTGAAASAPAVPTPAAPSASAAPAPHAIAIYVDETTSEQFNRNDAYAELSRFLEKGLPPGTVMALERFDGSIHLECPWTNDLEKIRTGLAAMQKHSYQPLIGAPGRMAPARGGGATAGSTGLAASEAAEFLERSVGGVIEALQRYPTEIARRRSLVLVTDGALFLTPTQIAEELIASSESTADRMPGPFKEGAVQQDAERDRRLMVDSASKPRWFSQWTDATDLAMRRGIEIVPVRSSVAEMGGNNTAEFSLGTDPFGNTGSNVTRHAAAPLGPSVWAGAGMQEVADITGGEPILARSNIGRDLRREVESGGAGYVLTFRDPHVGDHRFHRISIRLDRSKARLRFRRGYRVLGGVESLAERAVGGLYATPSDNPLGARTEIHILGKSAGSSDVGVLVAFPLLAGPAPDATRSVRVALVCGTKSGKRSAPFDIRATGKPSKMANGTEILVPIRLKLQSGTDRLSLAVRDEATGIVSILSLRPEL